MRASILFGLAIALLFFLGVVVAARVTGFFDPIPQSVVKKTPIKVLVAKVNLFKGVTISGGMVTVRDIYPEELDDYKKNRNQYLPAIPSAAHQLILLVNVPANTPLKKEYFRELGLPDNISERLGKGMTAVSLSLPKDRAGSGLLQVDEYVDVYLTTEICRDPKCKVTETARAQLARNLKIIAKRNSLWVVMQPVKQSGESHYILEANPYRAALIDFAKTKGLISLVPSSAGKVVAVRGSFSDLDSKEYKDEDERVAKMKTAGLVVGNSDLERIFDVEPFKMLPPPEPPLAIQRIAGINPQGYHIFDDDGTGRKVSRRPDPVDSMLRQPRFQMPGAYRGSGHR